MGSLKSLKAKFQKPPDFKWDFILGSMANLDLVLQGIPEQQDEIMMYKYKFKHLSLLLEIDNQKRTYLIKWELMSLKDSHSGSQYREIPGKWDSVDAVMDELTSVVQNWKTLGKMAHIEGW